MRVIPRRLLADRRRGICTPSVVDNMCVFHSPPSRGLRHFVTHKKALCGCAGMWFSLPVCGFVRTKINK